MIKNFVVGIDIGGTNVKLGLVDFSGKVLVHTSFGTKQHARSAITLIEALSFAVKQLLA